VGKVFVVKRPGADQVPFLRGVLVQSLVSAGLSFQDAYRAAQGVRDSLAGTEEIATAALRLRVAEFLEEHFGADVRRRYETSPKDRQEVVVHTPTRDTVFSVGVVSHCLEACAIGREAAWDCARRVQEALRLEGRHEIQHLELRRLIHRTLLEHCSVESANRYLSWRQFKASGDPLIILVGGATGTGKSTVTSALAYRLDIVRTQSTDMMREIIRCYLAPHVVPTLAYSSFAAWRGLPAAQLPEGQRATDNPVIAGFLSQFGTVKVALEATISRAVEERHDLIVDGVHVLPTELDLGRAATKAVVVPIMLAVTTKQQLATQLVERGRQQPEREASRYLEHLDAIWELQVYLLGLADQRRIPIVGNWSLDDTLREILLEINRHIVERHVPDPSSLG
jgi:2-phosphoglycerate kinase